ncbi:MAG: hypothetical protein NVS1B3_01670 [Candidatus Dormibacteraceae bacterium]
MGRDAQARGAQSVVLADGRVAGTWTHVVAKQVLHIAVEPCRRTLPLNLAVEHFLPLKAKTLAEVRRRAQSLAETLGMAKAEVKVG